MTSALSSILKRATIVSPFVGMLFLLLVSLFSTIKLTKPTEQFASRFAGITEIVPDNVTLHERRVSGLRTLLPPHGTVGYATDDDAGYARYEKYLTIRYVLAPILVEDSPHVALVVGNFTQPATDPQQFLRQRNLTLIKDLGQGVLLLEGAPR